MAGPVLPDGYDVLTVAAAAIRAGPEVAASLSQLLWLRQRINDVAASLKPAVAAEATGKRKGVAASVADCCGSGLPSGQDVAAFLRPAAVAAAFSVDETLVGTVDKCTSDGVQYSIETIRWGYLFPPSHHVCQVHGEEGEKW